MSMTTDQAGWFADTFGQLTANISQAVVGKTHVIQLAITCLLAEGHLLLEDFPGTGKTSLARSIAQTVHGTQSRIQFTPDLLPSDVTGVTIYDQNSRRFEFHKGPIFASIVLADEINRASPKTQAALLEVMEENRVTVDGTSYDVGRPFMVIATQNPIEQAGTYRLPEAQLDRFLMKTSLGYPDHASTVRILTNAPAHGHSTELDAVITSAALASMAELATTVHVDPAVMEYISRIAEETRAGQDVVLGVSVRACLALARCAKVWAAAAGRHYVVPDDIKQLAVPVLAHRMVIDAEAEFGGLTAEQVIGRILSTLAPPQERATA